jgi:hypothetical protein
MGCKNLLKIQQLRTQSSRYLRVLSSGLAANKYKESFQERQTNTRNLFKNKGRCACRFIVGYDVRSEEGNFCPIFGCHSTP